VLFQGRPLVVHAFTLDLPNLAFVHAEALNHQLSGTGNISPVVLGMNKSKENFLAPAFGPLVVTCALCHGIPLSWKQSGERYYPEVMEQGKLR
jgi:hypothetical protein